jgi:hypothetical protein
MPSLNIDSNSKFTNSHYGKVSSWEFMGTVKCKYGTRRCKCHNSLTIKEIDTHFAACNLVVSCFSCGARLDGIGQHAYKCCLRKLQRILSKIKVLENTYLTKYFTFHILQDLPTSSTIMEFIYGEKWRQHMTVTCLYLRVLYKSFIVEHERVNSYLRPLLCMSLLQPYSSKINEVNKVSLFDMRVYAHRISTANEILKVLVHIKRNRVVNNIWDYLM